MLNECASACSPPAVIPPRSSKKTRSIYEIDDQITAPSFGFEGADHYYETQSSQNFLNSIRVPTLLIQSKDDTYIPFDSYNHPALRANPSIHLAITEHGGHLGFLNRRGYRFWIDEAVVSFFLRVLESRAAVNSEPSAPKSALRETLR